jgi:hypothetical protein
MGSAAAQRVIDGGDIDDVDRNSLYQIEKLFKTSAANVSSYVQSRTAVEPLTGSLAATVDVTIDAVSQFAAEDLDVAALASALNDNGTKIVSFINSPSATTASPVVSLLGNLLSSVLRETGHVGETTLIL